MPQQPETAILNLRITLTRQANGRWEASTQVIEPQPDPWPMDPLDFGHAIQQARLRHGLRLYDVADEAALSTVTIRNIETGHTPPSPNSRRWIVAALAKLNVPPPNSTSTEEENASDEPDLAPTQKSPRP